MSQDMVDVKELRRLYSEDGCAKAILDHAAGRKKNSGKTDVDRLEAVLRQESGKFSRREIISTLKQLEKLHCGVFIIGRRGQPSRFEWTVEMIGLGKTAQGEQAEVGFLGTSDQEVEEAEERQPESNAETLKHFFMLRPHFSVVLNLPRDLSTKESLRLAEFIKTLPFNAEDQ